MAISIMEYLMKMVKSMDFVFHILEIKKVVHVLILVGIKEIKDLGIRCLLAHKMERSLMKVGIILIRK